MKNKIICMNRRPREIRSLVEILISNPMWAEAVINNEKERLSVILPECQEYTTDEYMLPIFMGDSQTPIIHPGVDWAVFTLPIAKYYRDELQVGCMRHRLEIALISRCTIHNLICWTEHKMDDSDLGASLSEREENINDREQMHKANG